MNDKTIASEIVAMAVALAAFSLSAVTVSGVVDTRTEVAASAVAGKVALGTPSGAIGASWNSTSVADGWRSVTTEGVTTNLLVLNSCRLRGGRLSADESWSNAETNVLRNSVVVPSGVTLTVGPGTIVKCTPGTAIEVEDGGSLVLKGATLADIADDTVGGDTNHDGNQSAPTAVADDFITGDGAPVVLRVSLLNGGTREGNVRWYTEGQTYGALPALTHDSFKFDGWFTESEGGSLVEPGTVVFVTTLYAHWTAYEIGLPTTERTVASAAGEYAFEVAANAAWTVSISAQDAQWVTLGTTSGTGNGTVAYTVAANGMSSERSATIRVACAGVVREFTVRQSGCDGVATPKITPADGTEFATSSRRCAISCATAGATIHYTLNGKDPDAGDPVYGGVSFNIFETTTIKARAFKDGLAASAIATSRVVKKQTLADALDVPLWTVTNDSDAPWTIDTDEAHGSKASVRSGAIGCEEETAITAEVTGAGTLSFWWKVSCEDSPDEDTPWDYLTCIVDGVEDDYIDGESGWLQKTITLRAGSHTIQWLYRKDDMDDAGHVGSDCGWVDCVSWLPDSAMSVSGMSESWLQNVGAVSGVSGQTVEQIASSDPDGDGLTVEQEYIAGTDPTDPESKFTAKIEMVDGEPTITWEPDLQADEQPRAYKTWGSTDLKTWEVVPDGKNADYNFFKVSVELPQ